MTPDVPRYRSAVVRSYQALPFVSFVPFASFALKPEHQLRRHLIRVCRQASAVARVVLKRKLGQQVALDGAAAAGLDARDRRVPRSAAQRAGDGVEAEVISAGGDVEPR